MYMDEIVQGMERFKKDLKPFCGGLSDWQRFDRGLAELKKMVPVKPYWYDDWLRCGHCERVIGKIVKSKSIMQRVKHCPRCGQLIDWDFFREACNN